MNFIWLVYNSLSLLSTMSVLPLVTTVIINTVAVIDIGGDEKIVEAFYVYLRQREDLEHLSMEWYVGKEQFSIV